MVLFFWDGGRGEEGNCSFETKVIVQWIWQYRAILKSIHMYQDCTNTHK